MKPTLALLLLSCTAFGWEHADDTVTITSTPPGAIVSWNRKIIGVTPMVYRVGEYAFNIRKTSMFSKHLSEPIILRISLDGYQDKMANITKPFTWRSYDGKNSYTYFIILVQSLNFKLDKLGVAPKTLTNADVIELWKAGFGEPLIIDKINGTATSFSLETKDLIDLRNAGVTDPIIQAMMHKAGTN